MSISSLTGKLTSFTENKKDFILLLIRIALGFVFFQAGLGKFMNFERTVGFFASLGIPMVTLNTALAVAVELVGGLMLIVGIGTRLITLPLAFVMVVALITAHIDEVKTLTDLFGQQTFSYMLTFLLLSSIGAGKYSLDHKLFGK